MLKRSLRQYLESLQRAGLSELPRATEPLPILPPPEASAEAPAPVRAAAPESPVRAAVPEPVRPAVHLESPATATTPPARKLQLFETPDEPPVQAGPSYPAVELERDERVSKLGLLAQKVCHCERCPELARTRKQTVFGVGNPEAEVMFIGEAPGADEDELGEPFVGKAGQLLNKIIEASKLKREEIYICNILRCRPPGNRNPKPEEAANCREYLDQQIAIINPSYILCWGSVAAQNLLGFQAPIGKMRQKWYRYGRAKVLCTYHPSYLLRNPAEKKKVWQDMKFFRAEMGVILE